MVDIHTHILHKIDDGSDSLDKSLMMVREAEKIGVTDLFCTPHYRYGNFTGSTSTVFEKFEELKKCVATEKIAVNLYLGQEIRYSQAICKLLKDKKVLTLNDTEYVLVEFDFDRKNDVAETVYELTTAGYKPIVAHVERYSYISIEDCQEIKNIGGYIQVNAYSFCAPLSSRDRRVVRELMKANLVDFVASDRHYYRKNYFKKAYQTVKKKYGDITAEKIFFSNAVPIMGRTESKSETETN